MSDIARLEEIRHAVLDHFYQRGSGIAHDAETVRRYLKRTIRNLDFDEIEAACAYLKGHAPPLLESEHDPLGATQYFKITTAGIQHHERSS